MSLINQIRYGKTFAPVEEATVTFKSGSVPKSDDRYNKSGLDCKIYIDFTRNKGHGDRFKITLGSKYTTTDNAHTVSVAIPGYTVVAGPESLSRKDNATIKTVTTFMQTDIMKDIVNHRLENKDSPFDDETIAQIIRVLFRDWSANDTTYNSPQRYNEQLAVVKDILGNKRCPLKEK